MHEAIVLGKLLHHRKNSLFLITAYRCSLCERAANAHLILLLSAQITAAEHSFLSDAMCNKYLKQMVRDLVKLVHSLDMSTNNRFFLFKHANRSVNLDIV